MKRYLGSVWKCRHFWLSLARMDVRERYHGSVIGIGWAMLHPVAMTAIICLVFAGLFGLEVRDFAPFLFVGLAFWTFITSSTTKGCHSFLFAESFIRQLPAPLAIYSLRITLAALFHLGTALAALLTIVWVAGRPLDLLALLTLVPTFALLLVLGWSISTLAGLLNTYFRDFQYVSEFALQMLFYMTPILYPPEMLRERQLGWILDINPLVPILELVRLPLVEGTVPSADLVLAGVAVTVLLAGFAALSLGLLERRLVFEL